MKPINKLFTSLFLSFFLVCAPSPSFAQEPEALLPQVSELIDLDDSLTPFESDEPRNEMSYWKEFFRMMMVLGIILGVVLLIAWILKGFLNKRVQQINESNVIKVIERRNLSQKSMIYLVEIYQKQFLIGDSAQGGIRCLSECFPPPEEEIQRAVASISKPSFMDILQRKISEKKLKPGLEK